jgi:hypothetical protein
MQRQLDLIGCLDWTRRGMAVWPVACLLVLGCSRGSTTLTPNAEVQVCSRDQLENPFAVNPSAYRCDATAIATVSPVPEVAAGISGAAIFEALRSQRPEARDGDVYIKAVEAGADPRDLAGAMSVGDSPNEWYDAYVFWSEGKPTVYLEVAKPAPSAQ